MNCPICGWGKRDDRFFRLTKHHVVPKRVGGGKLEGNIIEICVTCHTIIDYPHSTEYLRKVSARKNWSDADGKSGQSWWESMSFIAAHKRVPDVLDDSRAMFRINYYRSLIEAIEKRLVQKTAYLALEYIGWETEDA